MSLPALRKTGSASSMSARNRSLPLSGSRIVSTERSIAAGSQVPSRLVRQSAFDRRSERDAAPARLFEVIANDLVQLDEPGRARRQPPREALMQLRAGRLRQRVVRGIPDQQVAEAEGVVAGEHGPFRPNQLLPDETREARRDL